MLTKKAFVLSSALFLGLAGCSTAEKKEESSGSSGGGGGDQTVVDIFQFKVEFKDQFEELAKQYEEDHPEVDINVQTVGGGNDYGSALKSKFASGDEPAIFNINGAVDVQQYRDRLIDVSDTKAAGAALEGTLESVTEDGKVLGLPYNQEGYGFVYNKEIFEKAGVDADSIKSMDDLTKAVQTLDSKKDELGIDAVFAFAGKEKWTEGNHGSNSFIADDFNGSVMEAFQAKELPFTKAEQYKEYIDLQNKYSVQPVLSLDYSQQVEELFSTGRVAMIKQGNWVYPTIEQMDPELAENVGIFPIPVDGEMKMPVGVPQYWAVNKNADEEAQKAAKEFLDWLYTSDEGKEAVLTQFKFIPAYEGYDADKIADPLSKTIYQYAEEGNTQGWVFLGYPVGWSDILGAHLQKYLAGEASWEEAIQAAKNDWKKARQ
ncbi:ABC transporter substrate-binding protein [Domibacillus sp. DTU_2020_1001157_1_SI_ALB_TIR_016]|uniref:ABC transporter substrate-binding protein n=1 Tax=Domibacillus sp. DTU_2020_1001157_1_SI_ALB_TIR_016 TaxID=3077789 RepID=UPI0028E5CB82|nr:ABC transporter substrate-binding protein [Domibacillus sp. DTU_2020_1001157_1_SI_ALB_TIR_016]WNS81429.1 ABC transporter substrate-binding protein [Domibacillus sp. DTU_2020_1001157_1_SI_ALB_TIR_016]